MPILQEEVSVRPSEQNDSKPPLKNNVQVLSPCARLPRNRLVRQTVRALRPVSNNNFQMQPVHICRSHRQSRTENAQLRKFLEQLVGYRLS